MLDGFNVLPGRCKFLKNWASAWIERILSQCVFERRFALSHLLYFPQRLRFHEPPEGTQDLLLNGVVEPQGVLIVSLVLTSRLASANSASAL